MPPALAQILSGVLELLWWAVLVRVLLSWVVRDQANNPVLRGVALVTDPLLRPLQRVLTFGGMDLSPIVVLLLIRVAQRAMASAVT